MARTFEQIVVQALGSLPEEVAASARGDRRDGGPAAAYVLAAMLQVAGNDLEHRAWRRVSGADKGVASALLKTARTTAARRILRDHPEVGDRALAVPWVAAQLAQGGAAGRGPRSDQALRALRDLLIDSRWVLRLHRDGVLDDGPAGEAAALAAACLVWPVAHHQPFPALSVQDLQDDGMDLLLDRVADDPAAALGSGERVLDGLLAAAAQTAWFGPSPRELASARDALSGLAQGSGGDAGTRAGAGAVLWTVGLRLRSSLVAGGALDRLRATGAAAAGPRTDLRDAWVKLVAGNTAAAVPPARAAAEAPSRALRGEAGELLRAAGQTREADAIRASLSDDGRPGPHRLSVPGRPLPPIGPG